MSDLNRSVFSSWHSTWAPCTMTKHTASSFIATPYSVRRPCLWSRQRRSPPTFPLGGGLGRTVFPEGRDETSGYRGTLTQLDDVSTTYFDTLRIPLKKGRVFNDLDKKDTTRVAVINEAMAQHFWPDQEPSGNVFTFSENPNCSRWLA